MQIAGSKCKVCQQNIVLSTEGKSCGNCLTVVHNQCDPQPDCPVCGHPYQAYNPPKADVTTDSLGHRTLRAIAYGGGLLLVISVLLFVLTVLYNALMGAFAHSH
jgi:hypothetical protein